MKTERLENFNFKFSNRGFLVALAASSMLLMNSFNSMGKYSAGLKEINFVPKTYADDAMIIQLCKEAATTAHNDRMLSSRERADGLQNVTIGTSVGFSIAAVAVGGLALTPLVPIVLVIGGIEYSWMQSQVSTQLAEAEARSSNQMAADHVKCVEDHAILVTELNVLDQAETNIQFNYTSGALLGGLVDMPNGKTPVTSATLMR